MGRPVPLCSACQHNHFNFWSCERAAEQREKQEAAQAKKKEKKVYVQWRSDGPKDWAGERTKNFDKIGNMHWRKKEHWEGKGVLNG